MDGEYGLDGIVHASAFGQTLRISERPKPKPKRAHKIAPAPTPKQSAAAEPKEPDGLSGWDDDVDVAPSKMRSRINHLERTVDSLLGLSASLSRVRSEPVLAQRRPSTAPAKAVWQPTSGGRVVKPRKPQKQHRPPPRMMDTQMLDLERERRQWNDLGATGTSFSSELPQLESRPGSPASRFGGMQTDLTASRFSRASPPRQSAAADAPPAEAEGAAVGAAVQASPRRLRIPFRAPLIAPSLLLIHRCSCASSSSRRRMPRQRSRRSSAQPTRSWSTCGSSLRRCRFLPSDGRPIATDGH